MRCKLLCSFLCSLILWAPGFGQGQKPAPKTYALKAARLFDGKSNAVVTPGLILVSGGKIVAVGAAAKVPADAQIIDFGDATLLPGFIDAHTHLTFEYSDATAIMKTVTARDSLATNPVRSRASSTAPTRPAMRFASITNTEPI